jgi:hypothetical protein
MMLFTYEKMDLTCLLKEGKTWFFGFLIYPENHIYHNSQAE